MRLSMMEDEYNWLIKTLADDLENGRNFKLEGEDGIVTYSNNKWDLRMKFESLFDVWLD